MDEVRRGIVATAALGVAVGAGAQVPSRERAADRPEDALARCLDVAVRTSMYMDALEIDALLRLCTPDIAFVRPSTWPDVSIRGREQFRAVLLGRPAGFVSRHLFTNMIADRVAAGEVRVRSYFTHYSGTHAAGAALPIAAALRSVGQYDDRLVRQEGEWLLARREGRFVFGGL